MKKKLCKVIAITYFLLLVSSSAVFASTEAIYTAGSNLAADLFLGSTGDEVLAVQQRLTALGYDPGTPDGYFGTVTEAAVKEFQAANGLYVDGVVGSVTYNALFGHLNPEVGAVENSNTTFTLHQDGWYVARLEVEVWDKENQDYIWIYSDSCANGWHYYDQNGTKLKDQWLPDNGIWYYLDDKGVMATGWLLDNGKYYFLDETSGAMKTGWLYKDGSWYFLDYWTGARHTGWLWDNYNWYYMDDQSAIMKTGWLYDSGSWYYMYLSGAMATGWVYADNAWYYFWSDGSMATGDVLIEDIWYSFDAGGAWVE